MVAPAGEWLWVKADMVLFAGTLCDPYLSALEAFAYKSTYFTFVTKNTRLSVLISVSSVNRIGENSRLLATENF